MPPNFLIFISEAELHGLVAKTWRSTYNLCLCSPMCTIDFQPCDIIAMRLLLENAHEVSLRREILANPQAWIDEVDQCGSVMERIMDPSEIVKEQHIIMFTINAHLYTGT